MESFLGIHSANGSLSAPLQIVILLTLLTLLPAVVVPSGLVRW